MRPLRSLATVAFILVACAVSLPAQHPVTIPPPLPGTPPPSETGPTGPIHLDVVVDQNVSRKSEAPVTGLTQQDFLVTDNKAPRSLTGFQAVSSAQTQTPVQVTLILDTVNIGYSLVSSARQQVSVFLRSQDGHLAQPTRLAILTDKGLQIQAGYTQDGNLLAAGLDRADIGLRDIRRSSGFWGADERTELSIIALVRLVSEERSRPGRKLVVFISPGWPLLTGPAVEISSKQQRRIFDQIVTLSTQLRQARITLYNVNPIGAGENVGRTFYYKEFVKGAAKPSDADLGHLSLQVLAEQSGGRAIVGSNDISGMIRNAVADASAFYELTFDPPHAEHPDEYHRIDIRVDRPGLTVRAPQGYYDQP